MSWMATGVLALLPPLGCAPKRRPAPNSLASAFPPGLMVEARKGTISETDYIKVVSLEQKKCHSEQCGDCPKTTTTHTVPGG